MNESSSTEPTAVDRLQLGGFVLDLAAGELLSADRQLAGLRRQALEVLMALGRRAGQVVGKDELMDLVWPDVVVGEGSLTQAIADVRRALGDTEHRLVRNVARRGYMLVPDAALDDAPELSIAVMPFDVEGDAETTDWLADALHADLVNELTQVHDVVVMARDTAATYKGKPIDPRQVARELRVRYIVRGSLRYGGTVIRVSLALVDGSNGVQLWAESFVIDRAHLPQALAQLAVQIVLVLRPELYRSAVERRGELSALEVTADDLAMRAFTLWYRGLHGDNIVEALKLLERAVALDPDSVRAWGGLSFMNLHGVFNAWLLDRGAALRRIDEAAAQLERLDAESNYTYQARTIQSFFRQDWPAMLRVTTAWIARSKYPHAFGARAYALLLSGNAHEAIADLRHALRLSPRDPIRAEWQYRLAMAHFIDAAYDLACDWSQTAADTNPNLLWPPIHAAAMQCLGQTGAARQSFGEHMARHPGFEAGHIILRLPGGHPQLVEARERLITALKSVGMR
jgi:TolB-like protein